MADVKIVYDEDRITMGDLLAVEESSKSIRAQMNMLSRLVQNGDGKYVDHEEGFEILKEFSLGEIRRASEEIRDAAQGAAADPNS